MEKIEKKQINHVRTGQMPSGDKTIEFSIAGQDYTWILPEIPLHDGDIVSFAPFVYTGRNGIEYLRVTEGTLSMEEKRLTPVAATEDAYLTTNERMVYCSIFASLCTLKPGTPLESVKSEARMHTLELFNPTYVKKFWR